MKNLFLIITLISGVASASTEDVSNCTIHVRAHINGGTDMSDEKADQVEARILKTLENKGYTVVQKSEAAVYELSIGSIQYCYGKKGPPSWAYERGYGVMLTKGPRDHSNDENVIYDRTIHSMVLFGSDLATKKLKKAIRHLPMCE